MIASVARPVLYLKPPLVEDVISQTIRNQGWNVDIAANPSEAMECLERQPYSVGMVYLDESKPGECTLPNDAAHLLEADGRVNWVALLGGKHPQMDRCSRIISRYFYDYHTLPVDPARLICTLGHAHGMAALNADALETSYSSSLPSDNDIVGQSPAMRAVFKKIIKVAASDLNTLIRGDSGTGKELTALAIHRGSQRSNKPFVAVNCGSLPRDLIQAELFGHEKGAFTGAERRRVGRIESAQGGTIFLDEIGDLPLEMQINLLRFLQEKTIDRVGCSNPISVDVRVIAATNVNLEKAVERGRFREDLYYRLNVLHVDLPPLRERGDDIELLANHFFHQFSQNIQTHLKGFSQQAIDAIEAHQWPGNVRELVNRIQRAVVMCEGRFITVQDLGLDQDTPNSRLMTLAEARARAEKKAIETALGSFRNNVSKAARYLDISRVTLYRLMELHAIDWQRNKSGPAALTSGD